jgi:hypothetical protein
MRALVRITLHFLPRGFTASANSPAMPAAWRSAKGAQFRRNPRTAALRKAVESRSAYKRIIEDHRLDGFRRLLTAVSKLPTLGPPSFKASIEAIQIFWKYLLSREHLSAPKSKAPGASSSGESRRK